MNELGNALKNTRINLSGRKNNRNIVDIYYGLTNLGEELDDASQRQTADFSNKHRIVVMGNLIPLSVERWTIKLAFFQENLRHVVMTISPFRE